MFTMFKAVTAILAGIALVVDASPLVRRDVIAPTITNPKAGSVWPVGSKQTVTWDTSDLPPVSQITNIIGQVILGFDANDSLNLDFDHPLAKGFNLTTGSVELTVPNVPPRKDYLIVLFGDSGNTSPTFSITAISVPGSSSSSSSHPTTSTKSFNPTSPPFTGSTITGGESSTADESATAITGSVTTQAQPEFTSTTETSSAPSSTSTTPSSSTSPTGTGTALAGNASSTSAGWSLHRSTSTPMMLLIGAAISALILL